MIDSATAKRAGKLLGADIILTGTFAASGDKWNANIRMINVETGFIVAAIKKTGHLQELSTEAYREMKNISATFEGENSDMAGWILGTKLKNFTGKEGYQKVYVDHHQGANGTKASLTMDFKLGIKKTQKRKDKKIQVRIRNRLQRDLNNYKGIVFYVRGATNFTLRFQLTDKQKNSVNEENWYRNILVTKNWKKMRFSFDSLSLHRRKAMKMKTNQILDLGYIEKIEWMIDETSHRRGTEGQIWLDEISFF